MDLQAARAALPEITRAVFGEGITIIPYKRGKMSETVDPDRAVMRDVRARFDLHPDLEQVGGGRAREGAAMAASEVATISIDRRHPNLTTMLEPGFRVCRTDPVTGVEETYRVSRLGDAYPSIVLAYLSKV